MPNQLVAPPPHPARAGRSEDPGGRSPDRPTPQWKGRRRGRGRAYGGRYRTQRPTGEAGTEKDGAQPPSTPPPPRRGEGRGKEGKNEGLTGGAGDRTADRARRSEPSVGDASRKTGLRAPHRPPARPGLSEGGGGGAWTGRPRHISTGHRLQVVVQVMEDERVSRGPLSIPASLIQGVMLQEGHGCRHGPHVRPPWSLPRISGVDDRAEDLRNLEPGQGLLGVRPDEEASMGATVSRGHILPYKVAMGQSGWGEGLANHARRTMGAKECPSRSFLAPRLSLPQGGDKKDTTSVLRQPAAHCCHDGRCGWRKKINVRPGVPAGRECVWAPRHRRYGPAEESRKQMIGGGGEQIDRRFPVEIRQIQEGVGVKCPLYRGRPGPGQSIRPHVASAG